jgi:ABC-2 type transport system permease protein
VTAAVATARIVRHAVVSGARDYFEIWTWKSWTFGWLVRVFSQVTFFALIGQMLESPERTQFLLIGNAVVVAGSSAVFAINMTTAERAYGTLTLLVASPSRPAVVFAARGLYVAADGIATALLALAVMGPLFGLSYPWPQALLVVPLTALVGLAAYAFSTFLAGVIIRKREANGLVVNATIVSLMALCGVNVPVQFFPAPLEVLSRSLPVTHGLIAIRETIGGGGAGEILLNAGLEAGVGIAWLALALATFGRFVGHGRRDGSLDFAS